MADVAFLQGMIAQDTQALAMSSQAGRRAGSPEVTALADRIDRAHGPVIEQMNRMLRSWRQPRPQPGSRADMPMAGMMSEQQMAVLATTRGREFDRMYLQMMVEHHAGAISQAQAELTGGQNPEAKQLAEVIISAEQREITEMQALLGRI